MMKVCWVFVILMGFRISDAAQCQSSYTCPDKLEMVCVPTGQDVFVPCPELKGEIFQFNLFKNNEVIYNHSCHHDKGALNCTPSYSRMGVDLHIKNKSVSFKLTGVNASSHGAYRCMRTITFPPPYITPVPGAALVVVLLEGHHCKTNKPIEDPKPPERQISDFLWIWILGLVSVIIYSVIITTLALFFWVKLRRTDSQNDYMNTKPRAPRGHKRNRGVQNPAPRYF
ncbi:LOW QUALITY PROTEIN: T-cell-specific surface glycoprotein CD28-like [Xyrichtys novacula]|nr:LOW QUALITY PROTEIN: T-cell-specific surface glycoprotein CD28-like [Xyrichtys novacula]